MKAKKLYLELTEKEAVFLTAVLIEYRDIQKAIGAKQDKEYAPIRNKLTNVVRQFEGKESI